MGLVRTLAALFCAAIMAAQTAPAAASELDPSTWIVDCGGTYNLCGFVEKQSRMERIPRRFERAFGFSEGLAGVRVDGKYGYVDPGGKIVVAPKFDLVGDFHNGHAEALIGDQVGIIDRTGTFVLKPEYERAVPFGKSAALVLKGQGTSKRRMTYDRLSLDLLLLVRGDDLFSLVDLRSGKPLRTGLRIRNFNSDTFIWAKQADEPHYGLLAPDASWKLEPRYMEVQRLWNGRAIVCNFEGEQTRTRRRLAQCGSVDEGGNPALPMVPYNIAGYANGVYRFFDNKKTGLLNERGELIGERLFEDVNFAEPGDVLEVLENGNWVGLTREGKTVPNPGNKKVLLACPSGVRFLARDGGIEIVKDGILTAPYLFENSYLGTKCAFPMPVRFNGKYSFVDAEGKLLADPPPFDNTYFFADGRTGVSVKGKWGIINDKGRYTVEPRYDELRPDDSLFAVRLGDEKFWIDIRGERRPEPYRAAHRRRTLSCGDGGKIIGKKVNGQMQWGLADANGRTLIEPKYRAVSCFEGGLAWVPFDDQKVWCPIDRNERVREGVSCVTNWMASRIADAGPEKLSDDPYESGVLWMRANLDYGMGLRKDPPRIVGDFSTRF